MALGHCGAVALLLFGLEAPQLGQGAADLAVVEGGHIVLWHLGSRAAQANRRVKKGELVRFKAKRTRVLNTHLFHDDAAVDKGLAVELDLRLVGRVGVGQLHLRHDEEHTTDEGHKDPHPVQRVDPVEGVEGVHHQRRVHHHAWARGKVYGNQKVEDGFRRKG